MATRQTPKQDRAMAAQSLTHLQWYMATIYTRVQAWQKEKSK